MFISKENFLKNVTLAWPMALNALLLQSVIIIDLMLVAPLGEIPVAALGIATAIIGFLTGTQYALANGTQMLIARANGAKDSGLLAKTFVAGWVLNFSFSIITFCILYLFMSPLLTLVADDVGMQTQAGAYLKITAFMLLISSLTQVMIVYFNGSRKTRIPLYGFLIELPFNVSISWILIYGLFGFPALGLAGAGIGSLLAVVIRFIYLFAQLNREKELNYFSGFALLKRKDLSGHFSEISPIAANFVILTGGAMLYQILFAQLDVTAYAAITLVFPWMRFGSQFVNSWAQATAINVSQYIGEDRLKEIPEFVPQAMRITSLLSIVIAFGFFGFSIVIPYIYPAMSKETLTALAVIAPIYIALPLFRTYNTICGHTLRSLGESFRVLRVHIVTQWAISLPLCALMIYLKLPLFWVFSIVILEELLKAIPFNRFLKRRLVELSA